MSQRTRCFSISITGDLGMMPKLASGTNLEVVVDSNVGQVIFSIFLIVRGSAIGMNLPSVCSKSASQI
jgi:hypothetical protein